MRRVKLHAVSTLPLVASARSELTIFMALFPIFRVRSSPIIPLHSSKSSRLLLSTISSADLFYDHLQKTTGNVEKSLATVRTKLDSRCVNEVLRRCSSELSQNGIRFFIWAGRQSNYRHSSFMYSRACELLGINRSPSVLLNVIEDYRNEGCYVDVRMFKIILNLCKEAKLASEALSILGKMPEFDLRADTNIYNLVIRLFTEKGEIDKAMELMKEMDLKGLFPDMITYIAMVKGLCDSGRLEDACRLFKTMKENGCTPNAVAYSVLLNGFCRHGIMEKTMEFLEEMEKEGGSCSPNVVTYTSIIQNLCEMGRPLEALKILDRMEDSGCFPNRVTANTLIKEFCKEGQLKEAYKLIDRVVAGGGVSLGDCYSSLVVCLVMKKRIKEAEEVFRNMVATGVKPDSVACSVMLKELCLEGRAMDGFILCSEIDRIGHLSSIDSDVYSLLLVGLCEKDHFGDAANLARLMLKKGIRLEPRVIERLEKSGDQELVVLLSGIKN